MDRRAVKDFVAQIKGSVEITASNIDALEQDYPEDWQRVEIAVQTIGKSDKLGLAGLALDTRYRELFDKPVLSKTKANTVTPTLGVLFCAKLNAFTPHAVKSIKMEHLGTKLSPLKGRVLAGDDSAMTLLLDNKLYTPLEPIKAINAYIDTLDVSMADSKSQQKFIKKFELLLPHVTSNHGDVLESLREVADRVSLTYIQSYVLEQSMKSQADMAEAMHETVPVEFGMELDDDLNVFNSL